MSNERNTASHRSSPAAAPRRERLAHNTSRSDNEQSSSAAAAAAAEDRTGTCKASGPSTGSWLATVTKTASERRLCRIVVVRVNTIYTCYRDGMNARAAGPQCESVYWKIPDSHSTLLRRRRCNGRCALAPGASVSHPDRPDVKKSAAWSELKNDTKKPAMLKYFYPVA